jgi:hypothetical protein
LQRYFRAASGIKPLEKQIIVSPEHYICPLGGFTCFVVVEMTWRYRGENALISTASLLYAMQKGLGKMRNGRLKKNSRNMMKSGSK